MFIRRSTKVVELYEIPEPQTPDYEIAEISGWLSFVDAGKMSAAEFAEKVRELLWSTKSSRWEKFIQAEARRHFHEKETN